MNTPNILLPPKTAKDASLTVRIPKVIRAKADKLAQKYGTSLAAVVEAGIKLLDEKSNEKTAEKK